MKSFILVALLISAFVAGAVGYPKVIIVGAGMSGISAAKTLSDAGITDFVILEGTDHIGGRIHNVEFGDVYVEKGANWVEGVNGEQVNPIWTMAKDLNLRTFYSNFDNLSQNVYKETGGLYDPAEVQEEIDRLDKFNEDGEKFSNRLPSSGIEDISQLTYQRLLDHVPSTPLEMAVDYYGCDYEYAEPPRVTSLQNTVPLPTFANYGEDVYFVADQRGYATVVYNLAKQFLKTSSTGAFTDSRLKLNQVVTSISYSGSRVVVTTEDGVVYKADYVMVSVSLGVLQSNLIKFTPTLPAAKLIALYQFDMSVYTKIFLKFPYKFWPDGNGTEFFLYASERRGYYPIWQHFEKQYPGENVLLVTVTDDESRRIEQESDEHTLAEIMGVLRNMFGEHIPNATNIYVPRWWSDRLYKGSFSNWPIGVDRHEFDQMRAPVGRVYFTGEHTSTHYNGYVHGAYLAGIDSAKLLLRCIRTWICSFEVAPKHGETVLTRHDQK